MTKPESTFINAFRARMKDLASREDETLELFAGFHYETSKEIADKYRQWLKDIQNGELYAGAIGGRLTYKITPTSLGMIAVVEDSMSKTEFELTDFLSW